jgi:tellurite resistance protein
MTSCPFFEFSKTLDDDQRDALFSSVPMLVAMVVGADGEFDDYEMEATVDALLAAAEVLGDEFRWSEAAKREFDHITKSVREGGVENATGRLSRLGQVVRLLPDDLRHRYQDFITAMVMHLAESSGGFLFFIDSVSEEEKIALRKIVVALGLKITDPLDRARLDLD